MTLRDSKLGRYIRRHRRVHLFLHSTYCRAWDGRRGSTTAGANYGGRNTQIGTVAVIVNGPPSGSVLIEIQDPNGNTVDSAAASPFAFTNLTAGSYTVVVPASVTGYTISQTSYPVVVDVGESVTVTITYTASSTTPPPPGNGTLYVGALGLASGVTANFSVVSSSGVVAGTGSVPSSLVLLAGTYTVTFAPVPGYTPTTNQVFMSTVTTGGSVTVNGSYTAVVTTPPSGSILGGYIFPAYQSNPGDPIFTTIINAKNQYGSAVPSIVVLNPNSGPVPYTAAWGTLISNLHANGWLVGLYVDTGTGPYTLTQIQASVAGYAGYLADYIFFDDFHAGMGGWTTSYAASCESIAKAVGMKGIANPGTALPSSAWFGLFDIWVIWESPNLPVGTIQVQVQPPYTGGTPSEFAVIGYSSTFPTSFITAAMPSQIGWVYVTDNSNLGADYQSDTRDFLIPTFQLLDSGATGTAPPPPPTGTASVTYLTINQTGQPIVGYYGALTTDAAGLNLVPGAYGGSPAAWVVPAGNYYLFAGSYGSCTFTNFTNPAGAATGVPVTLAGNSVYTFTAQYLCTTTTGTGSTATVTISAIDTSGNPVTGIYVAAPGAVPTSGFTPAQFTCVIGNSYTFTPENYTNASTGETYTFAYWSDNVTGAARSELVAGNLSFVAVYTLSNVTGAIG